MKKQICGKDIDTIINDYSDMVTRLCLINLKNEDDAKDCFQNVFMKLIHNKTEFHDLSHVKHWLIKVTINECRNYYRVINRNIAIADLVIPIEDNHDLILLPEVLKLPKKYKNVLYLYYYEGYKISEIAQILDKNENTVKSYLKRGRELLKRKIGDKL